MQELLPAIVHYCKYQERCHSETRNKLYELGLFTADVELQLSMLIEGGILNEERYAQAFARGRWRLKQWGRQKIKYELKAKKVSDYCIRKALLQIDEDEYLQVLQKMADRKWQELAKDRSIYSKKAKFQRYFQQKGYESDLIFAEMKRLSETQ